MRKWNHAQQGRGMQKRKPKKHLRSIQQKDILTQFPHSSRNIITSWRATGQDSVVLRSTVHTSALGPRTEYMGFSAPNFPPSFPIAGPLAPCADGPVAFHVLCFVICMIPDGITASNIVLRGIRLLGLGPHRLTTTPRGTQC